MEVTPDCRRRGWSVPEPSSTDCPCIASRCR